MEKTLGPDHPSMTNMRINRGGLLEKQVSTEVSGTLLVTKLFRLKIVVRWSLCDVDNFAETPQVPHYPTGESQFMNLR